MDSSFPSFGRKATRANTMAKSAQQKIELKIPMENAKMRGKALKTAIGLPGAISAQVGGEKLVVVGEGLDPVALMVMLRKKMGFAELVSVSPVEEKKEEQKETEGAAGAVPYNQKETEGSADAVPYNLLHTRTHRTDGDWCCVM